MNRHCHKFSYLAWSQSHSESKSTTWYKNFDSPTWSKGCAVSCWVTSKQRGKKMFLSSFLGQPTSALLRSNYPLVNQSIYSHRYFVCRLAPNGGSRFYVRGVSIYIYYILRMDSAGRNREKYQEGSNSNFIKVIGGFPIR